MPTLKTAQDTTSCWLAEAIRPRAWAVTDNDYASASPSSNLWVVRSSARFLKSGDHGANIDEPPLGVVKYHGTRLLFEDLDGKLALHPAGREVA